VVIRGQGSDHSVLNKETFELIWKFLYIIYESKELLLEQEISIGEAEIIKQLDLEKVVYETEKTFKNFTAPDGQHYTFDFYLPNSEVLIECQGHQHYKAATKDPKEVKRFDRTVKRDDLKVRWCKEQGYKLICIKSGRLAHSEILGLLKYYPEMFSIKRSSDFYRKLIRFIRRKFPLFVNII